MRRIYTYLRSVLHRVDLTPFSMWPHELELIETYDQYTRKLRCECCGRYYAMSDRHQAVLPWDDEFEEITKVIYGVPRSKL